MEMIASYFTDAGNVKTINQDSLSAKIVNSPKGKIAFAVICDGMGGLEQGERASKEVVLAFNNWFHTDFATMVASDNVSAELIYSQWQKHIDMVNQRILEYSETKNVTMGTTLTALLIYQQRYYYCHVGDSRLYKVAADLQMLTMDHTLVAEEVRMGLLSEEEAKDDPRRSILLQCVGASTVIEPQMNMGNITEDTTFVMCSDGLIHKITAEELTEKFCPHNLNDKEGITDCCKTLVELAMSRGERDNITVIGIVVKA